MAEGARGIEVIEMDKFEAEVVPQPGVEAVTDKVPEVAVGPKSAVIAFVVPFKVVEVPLYDQE